MTAKDYLESLIVAMERSSIPVQKSELQLLLFLLIQEQISVSDEA